MCPCFTTTIERLPRHRLRRRDCESTAIFGPYDSSDRGLEGLGAESVAHLSAEQRITPHPRMKKWRGELAPTPPLTRRQWSRADNPTRLRQSSNCSANGDGRERVRSRDLGIIICRSHCLNLSSHHGIGFVRLPGSWFEDAYSKRHKSLENKAFWHLDCATQPPLTPSYALEIVDTGTFQ